MDRENQARVKKIAENAEDGGAPDNIIVVIGTSDIEGALISAETVTIGDPSFSEPLAGVSLGPLVYHILEPVIRDAIPEDIYEENDGIWALTINIDDLGERFEAIRKNNS
jgi:glycine reductase